MKIFIVKGIFNAFEYEERNLKAFKSKKDAEKYSIKATNVLSKMSNHLKIYETLEREIIEEHMDMDEEEFTPIFDNFRKSDSYVIASAIHHAHIDFQDFDKCIIQKMELI